MNDPRPSAPVIHSLRVSCYTVPTETPESDGTLKWEKTTLVLVEATAGDKEGMGYSYADVSTAKLIESLLVEAVKGMPAFDIPATHAAMLQKIRNLGRPGIVSMAIAAVDNALWDLKAKLLECSLLDLLGAARESAEFTAVAALPRTAWRSCRNSSAAGRRRELKA